MMVSRKADDARAHVVDAAQLRVEAEDGPGRQRQPLAALLHVVEDIVLDDAVEIAGGDHRGVGIDAVHEHLHLGIIQEVALLVQGVAEDQHGLDLAFFEQVEVVHAAVAHEAHAEKRRLANALDDLPGRLPAD